MIGARVHHGDRPLKASGTRPLLGGHSQVPLSSHVGAIPGLLEQGGDSDHVIAQRSAAIQRGQLCRGKHLGDIWHPRQLIIDTRQ